MEEDDFYEFRRVTVSNWLSFIMERPIPGAEREGLINAFNQFIEKLDEVHDGESNIPATTKIH